MDHTLSKKRLVHDMYFKTSIKYFVFIGVYLLYAMCHGEQWTPSEMLGVKSFKDIQLSPDNQSVLFVMTEIFKEGEQEEYRSRIYRKAVSDQKPPQAVTQVDSSATKPKWSPDGKWIAFLSNRSGVATLYLINPQGGEAFAAFSSKKDVQTFSWSPDSSKIAFVMGDEKRWGKGHHPKSTPYVYGEDPTVNRLWMIEIGDVIGEPKALTPDEYHVRGVTDRTAVEDFDWSPDGKEITFAFSPSSSMDILYLESSLATVNLSSGNIEPWEKHAQYQALPRYSPDGQWVAYLANENNASDHAYTFNRRIHVRASRGGPWKQLAPTFNEGPFIFFASHLGWTSDGQNILFFEPKGTKFHLAKVPLDGSAAHDVVTGDWFFKDPSLSYDRSMLGFVGQSPNQPPEVYVASLETFKPVQISDANNKFLKFPDIQTEHISWKSDDGLNIEALLTFPLDYQMGKSYPLLLVIHGGPQAFFDETYLGSPSPYPLAAFAQKGFMILRPNPRGSCGYGKEFRWLNYNDWGGKDFDDLMAGVDMLIKNGMADPDRLGVMGWSYGGYMTARMITQTNRFKAASVGAGISNLVSLTGTTDVHRFLPDYMGSLSQNSELYHERSPVYYTANVETPCLIQHGDGDKRVPISQAYELYNGLKREGKQVTLIVYPGMDHALGSPKWMLDAMERNFAWFSDHLLFEQAHMLSEQAHESINRHGG